MRKIFLPLIALTLLVSCQKGMLEEPKSAELKTGQLKPNANKVHVNSLSYSINGVDVNAETFTVELVGNLLTIRGVRVITGAGVSYTESLTLRIDGYNGVAGTFPIGSPDGWGNPTVSTTTAQYGFTFTIQPPSREGIFEIKKVKKNVNGNVITGTFSIVFGANGFNDRILTNGHFSLLVPKI